MFRLRTMPLLVLFVLSLFLQNGYAQEEYSMAEMMEMGKPGPEHEMLGMFAGDWDLEMQFNMEYKPGGQMAPMKGTGTGKAILGGRFIQFENTLKVMGQDSKSVQIMGFDRRFKKYTYYAVDEMGTYGITAEGNVDDETGLLVMDGIDTWPLKDGGVKEQNYKLVYTFPKDGKFTFKVRFEHESGEMYDMLVGTATKK